MNCLNPNMKQGLSKSFSPTHFRLPLLCPLKNNNINNNNKTKKNPFNLKFFKSTKSCKDNTVGTHLIPSWPWEWGFCIILPDGAPTLPLHRCCLWEVVSRCRSPCGILRTKSSPRLQNSPALWFSVRVLWCWFGCFPSVTIMQLLCQSALPARKYPCVSSVVNVHMSQGPRPSFTDEKAEG